MARIVVDYTRLTLLTEQLKEAADNIVKGQNRLMEAIVSTKDSWEDVAADDARQKAADTVPQLDTVVAKHYRDVSDQLVKLVGEFKLAEEKYSSQL